MRSRLPSGLYLAQTEVTTWTRPRSRPDRTDVPGSGRPELPSMREH